MNSSELERKYKKAQDILKREYCSSDECRGWHSLCKDCKLIDKQFNIFLNKTDYMKVQNEWESFHINFMRGENPTFISKISEHMCKLGYRGLMCSAGAFYVKVKFFKEKKKK